jgi:hypothetical protein
LEVDEEDAGNAEVLDRGMPLSLALANKRSVGADILRATRPLLIADVRLRGGNGDDLACPLRARPTQQDRDALTVRGDRSIEAIGCLYARDAAVVERS